MDDAAKGAIGADTDGTIVVNATTVAVDGSTGETGILLSPSLSEVTTGLVIGTSSK